jgi:hypothetical protein
LASAARPGVDHRKAAGYTRVARGLGLHRAVSAQIAQGVQACRLGAPSEEWDEVALHSECIERLGSRATT